MQKNIFWLLLISISFIGLALRLIDYDRVPPFGETKDEFAYPWAGMSLLQTGKPTSWSPFVSYPTKYSLRLWGEIFPMVTPFIEKPLLYPILTGLLSLAFGENSFAEVRLTTIRLLPIILNSFTMIFIGLFTAKIFNRRTGILASLLYAILPTIVLGNRLSLTENLLIPLSLMGLLLTTKFSFPGKLNFHLATKVLPHLLGLTCGLAIITKQVGFILPLTILILLAMQKQWRPLLVVTIYSIIFILIHPLITFYFGWDTYVKVTEELRHAHALGLPEAIATLFRFPGIGHKESIFLDGSMLTGFILLFSAPFWIHGVYSSRDERSEKSRSSLNDKFSTSTNNKLLLLLYPFIYLISLDLGEGGQTWYGWHIFPLYPFVAIFLAIAFFQIWSEFDGLKLVGLLLPLGSSSIRFLLLFMPVWQNNWQTLLGILVVCGVGTFFLPDKLRKFVLLVFFILYCIVNIYTVMHLGTIYPSHAQPL